jgi:hypothetical protein
MVYYSLDDIEEIKQNGFVFELPKTTQDSIMSLSKRVGAPNYIKTPIFQKKRHIEGPDWDLLKQFKPTAKVERTDNEQLIQFIKTSLNKMTDKNYEKMRDEIFENLEKLESSDVYDSVNDIIFTIASSNRFYSKIYATLYKELMLNKKLMENGAFDERLRKEVANYLEKYTSIKMINANENYEEFCEANKEHEKRKALTEFFVHLMIMNVIKMDEMVSIHNKLCELTLKHVFDEEHKQTLMEISENMYILMKTGGSAFKDADVLAPMLNQVKAISKLSVKQHPGLSNKAIFKFMDITEIKV